MIANLITAVRVERLFGLYTYELPEIGSLSNAAILYGDNGLGKSTLLRLVFHLLSAANDRGHRTALIKSEFLGLEVDLSSGITLRARPSQDNGIRMLTLDILRDGEAIAIWEYSPTRENRSLFEGEEFTFEIDGDGRRSIKARRRPIAPRSKGSIPRGNEIYLSVLSQHAPKMFILNAERRLDSDTVADPSDEVELRRVMHYGEPKRINDLVVRSREIALSQAMSAAARWIGRKAIIATNQGSMNVHSVYIDVLHHLLAPVSWQSESLPEASGSGLVKKLADIEARMAEHAKYELATQLSTGEFRKALSEQDAGKSRLAAELLQPYIRSLDRRLQAVEPIYQLIDRFIKALNEFLSDKTIAFTLSQGFSIRNRLGNDLAPAQLSSGEQQLLLLFCYVLTARDEPSVFMIDEPEISLNIKWQRRLVQSLLEITEGATIQFIFASHSMELLAQHRSRVVRLVDKS